ncbi:MAG TPA: hypothetical protein VI112_11290 [Bacteroidia bacterium]|jgi:hypothetical protein
MKKFLLFTCLLSFIEAHSQSGFINITDNDTFPESFGTEMREAFREPASFKYLTVFAEYLDSAGRYDLSLLKNLEVLVVKFSFDPSSGDTARIPFVKKTHDEMMMIQAFRNCPKLRAIVFSIGEQIYLSDPEKKELGLNGDKEYSESVYKKRVKENLQNAWKDFGDTLQQKLPGIKLYAYDWGW